jgi:biopolymer transport protein ExbB
MNQFKKKYLSFFLVFFINNLFAASNSKLNLQDKFTTTLNLKEIFLASPIIYTILGVLSIAAFAIWIVCLITFREKNNISDSFKKSLRNHLLKKDYEKAANFCDSNNSLFSSILSSAIKARTHGPQFISDSMKSKGQRYSAKFWQRISLLNDIVVIAPMLGLLGTVIGMFYAFYDMNRSIDSISALFDGLGIAIGTTVAGLIVAILAMIFHATLKFRLIKILNLVDNEAHDLSFLIHSKSKNNAVRG